MHLAEIVNVTGYPPALVLDADHRSALATIRSLGRRGVAALALVSGERSLGAASRYASHHVMASPQDGPIGSAVSEIGELVRTTPQLVLFPTTDASTMLSHEVAAGADVRVVAPRRPLYEMASDKAQLLRIAEAAGLPTPRTTVCESREVLLAAIDASPMPAVIKPSRSRVLKDGCIVPTAVHVVRSIESARQLAGGLEWVGHVPALLQEFIPGHGAGIFALYGPQGPVAWFAHRRLREKPPAGGVSVLSESVPTDPALKRLAERLLDALSWQGLAMVEFRIAPDGTPYLMEINARLWGSVQLAIDCGVDFPWLAYRLAMGERVEPVAGYAVGRRLRWFLGDVDSLWLRWKDPALGLPAKLAGTGRFLATFLDWKARNEVFRLDDPRPAWAEFRQWLGDLT